MRRLATLLFLALLYLPALGASESGTHPDESYYLAISAEMDRDGAWLTPTMDGIPFWYKPPLLYWAERAAYSTFGRDFFAARLPAALCAIALALLTGALARRMYGERAGLLATLLTAGTFGFLRFGRMAMMDAPMALALTLAAYGAWRAAEEERPLLLLLCGVGAAMATMLKGPVGAVLVLLIAGGWLALRKPRLLASRHTLLAFAVGAALALPWYALSLSRHGRRFWQFFVVEQNVDRFRHPWTLHGEATLLVGFLVFLLPWTFLFLGSLPALRRLREPGVLLPAVWIAAVLLLFTVPSLKWPHYGLACSPAAVLLACRAPPPRWARIATALVLTLAAAVIALAPRFPMPAAGKVGFLLASALLLSAAIATWAGRLAGAAALGGLGLAALVAVALPTVNPPALPAGARDALDGREVWFYGPPPPGVFTLALGRPVHKAWGAGAAAAVLRAGGAVIVAQPNLAEIPVPQGQLRELLRWNHLPGNLPPAAVAKAWRAGDPSPLFEPMLAVSLR
ncbi:MAG TPA: glycosyltransferase family 39 protein [Anaeromyxobacteraceae bacterium]|nr:glycosyltransferase family 39 protein [Anaeromyxobacteraceae bacterium]